jgi:hypothetical protein
MGDIMNINSLENLIQQTLNNRALANTQQQRMPDRDCLNYRQFKNTASPKPSHRYATHKLFQRT